MNTDDQIFTMDFESMDWSLPRDTGIRLRVTKYDVKLMYHHMVQRRWWQLWKPREWLQVDLLKQVEYQIRTNQRINLSQEGSCYTVTVDDKVVLQYGGPEDDDNRFGSL